MTEPTGYTALDLIGFTDQGDYNSSKTYVQNDLVHYDNSVWRCLIDDTTGQTPEEGSYWTIFVESTVDASGIGYDNTSSGLAAENVQDAIDEVVTDLAAKQDTLTFDTTPTSGSTNPVTSGGLYTAFGNLTYHNIPRLEPKDITSYVEDESLWDRLNGTNGYDFLEDIYVGDYILMSRAISAYEQTQTYQATGSQYVTIIGINSLMGNGNTAVSSNHLVMTAGQGFSGTQHFGRSRMNSSNSTSGGYVGSEMFTTTLGAVASSGSTASTATINQQLYAEFGSHLLTTYELLSNAINSSGYNRFGTAGGCSSGWAWTACQAVLMSEAEVYGSIAWSSSGFDTGNANHQFPLFAHSKQAINNRSAYYWLKDVASSAYFCRCSDVGISACSDASLAHAYVRPRFVLA